MKYSMKICFLALLMSTPAGVTYAKSNDAAWDQHGQAVIDARSNCVRTKWMGDQDPCAPAPAPAPTPVVVEQPAPAPAPAPEPELVVSQEARTVYFDFNSAELTDEAKSKLTSLAQQINGSKRVTEVHMVGFTDQIGSASYNQALSQKRVDAVHAYLSPLIKLAIDPASAEFRAAGKAPNSKCDAVKKRAERINCMHEERRVEVVLGHEHTK